MVYGLDRALLVTLVVGQALDAASVVSIAWVGKHIIDAIVHPPIADALLARATPALGWVALEFALIGGRALVSQSNSYAQLVLRSKLGLHVNLLILDKANRVAYARFEDPVFMNSMTQARREASARPLDLVTQALALAKTTLTLTGFAALLWSLGAWAIAILIVTALPPFWAEARFANESFLLQRARSLRYRRSFYLESVLTTEATVKEVKLFQLAGWLRDKYKDILESFHAEETGLARRRSFAAFTLGLLGSLALYGTYGWIVAQTVAGAITLGAMTLYMGVFRQGQDTLRAALSAISKAWEDDLYMTNLDEFLAVPEEEPDAAEPLDAALPDDHAPSLSLDNVSFRYPGGSRDALTDITLHVAPGETIALVGKNGAGKTTLIKLLVGLFRPTSGIIRVDNVDVATLSMSALRRRVGVIFQDFARLQLSMRDNVGVGWLPSRDDDIAVGAAITDGGASEIVERLPNGLETPLGRAFGGDDLSGGQWQRIALARAFMRKSRILVLDEPTASMDAEGEHEIFQRFRDLKKDRTAILITHRFGTVRMADRIVVIDGGRIVEQGTHDALLALGGLYARMFSLQAEGLRGGG
ncbi:ABC transporter permease [Deltaproteobacteria bacterium]|nr:ABC transporter permease [Deltaproteobacteria bacterium]